MTPFETAVLHGYSFEVSFDPVDTSTSSSSYLVVSVDP